MDPVLVPPVTGTEDDGYLANLDESVLQFVMAYLANGDNG